ncbi:phospholipase D family protein [Pseudothermotoga sp. U03pept]|uniref:phospholipase D family nuclease n=1 Tax=Pseudothermotoga sp. U03pept TaxID=3447012 RepID=UPI003F075D7B
MKRIVLSLLLLCTLLLGFEVEVLGVYFSPKGGSTNAIVQQIQQAEREIKVMIYSFTSKPIADALLEAFYRGIHVEIIIDEANDRSRYSQTPFLRKAGIPVYVDAKESIHHNKVIVIDEEIVITGSFNFSKAAEQTNAENLVILKSSQLAAIYLENYEVHKAHSYLVFEVPAEIDETETATPTEDATLMTIE